MVWGFTHIELLEKNICASQWDKFRHVKPAVLASAKRKPSGTQLEASLKCLGRSKERDLMALLPDGQVEVPL